MGSGSVYAGQRGGVFGVGVLGIWVREALRLVGHCGAELFGKGGGAVMVRFVHYDARRERFGLGEQCLGSVLGEGCVGEQGVPGYELFFRGPGQDLFVGVPELDFTQKLGEI